MPTAVAPGLIICPLRAPTLPPATHTNAALVGADLLWVVDPGSPHPEELDRLAAALAAARAEGARVAGVLLTHHHQDHVGGARWLADTYGVPVVAHAATKQALEARGVRVDRVVGEGDVLPGLGAEGWALLHTPGHARGHLVLWQASGGILLAGDMVASEGTIVVDPPGGHMATYVAQLERLIALGPQLLVPAHGAPVSEPVARLRFYVAHRREREARVAAALETSPRSLVAITFDAYPDVSPAHHPLASRSALAHLIHLAELGRAAEGPFGRWRRVG